ncbi:hypothetical protein SOVF_073100 [Spinacia oleracea]|nr:hypothetical protein SOVF_073100 [Spinacia oleracea]
MAATANTNPSPPLSPASAVVAAAATPHSLSSPRTGPSPWNQIVRGLESDPTGPPTPPSAAGEMICSPVPDIPAENSENGGNAGGKKPVWNKKPSNGPVEKGKPGPVVMGPAEAWPALSESTKASTKLSASDSSKNLPDVGSVSSPQVSGTEPSSLSIIAPIQSLPQPSLVSPKLATSNLSHSPMPNHGRPVRQKSIKRDGGGNQQANGAFTHQLSPAAEDLPNHSHSSTKSTSDNHHGHREQGSRNTSGDHPQTRNSYRRGSGSHQNYGGRRGDQDRGNNDWNHQRSFNGRDSTMQQRVSPRGYARPVAPPVSAPFVHPASMRPFMGPMGLADMYYIPGHIPFVAPVPGPLFMPPVVDAQLHTKIVNQIDYYFSNENLIKDTYLRQNMDEHGWVPVALIANFKKGDKIRKRDDWVKWIMPPSVQFSPASDSLPPMSPTIATLPAHFQNVKVNEKTIDQNHPKGQIDVNAATILSSSSGVSHNPLHTVMDGESSNGR